jgi:hypothetical protein
MLVLQGKRIFNLHKTNTIKALMNIMLISLWISLYLLDLLRLHLFDNGAYTVCFKSATKGSGIFRLSHAP